MIDAGQFILSKEKYSRPDFECLRLRDGYYLSFHKKLRVYTHCQYPVLLLGIAWQAGKDRQDPVCELEMLAEKWKGQIPEREILAMEETWCGRYVLIVGENVYLDATGLLGVFYGGGAVSSSLRLLAEYMRLPERLFEPSGDINWLPGPFTQYDSIRRLLPSQIYGYCSGVVRPRELRASLRTEKWSEEERISLFVDTFRFSLSNLRRAVPGKEILIALTGGYDSRTLLSLAKDAKLRFSSFTLEHDRMPEGDVGIPQELSEIAGCPYFYIFRKKENFRREWEDEYTRHTLNLADDGDKSHYAHGQYQELVQRFGEVVILRSSVWEVAIDYLEKVTGSERSPENLCEYYNLPKQSLEHRSLEAYFQWAAGAGMQEMSAANQFFWEQRYGSWMSSIEQSFDLMDGVVSLHPVNSRFFLSLLMDFPKEERLVRMHQVKIMARACPELAKVRFSGNRLAGSGPLSELWEKCRQGLQRLRKYGFRKTFCIYRDLLRRHLQMHRTRKEKEKELGI